METITAFRLIPIEIYGILGLIGGLYAIWIYFKKSKPYNKTILIFTIYLNIGFFLLAFLNYTKLFPATHHYVFLTLILGSLILFLLGIVDGYIKGTDEIRENLKIYVKSLFLLLIVAIVIIILTNFFL